MRTPLFGLLIVVSGLLAGCPGTQSSTCSGPEVLIPGGKCTAYYYQADYGAGSATTQALVKCLIDSQQLGGNVVAFHTLDHGIELKWLDETTLEVAVPKGAKLEDRRLAAAYMGHKLVYRYRYLQPSDQQFVGCLGETRGGT